MVSHQLKHTLISIEAFSMGHVDRVDPSSRDEQSYARVQSYPVALVYHVFEAHVQLLAA